MNRFRFKVAVSSLARSAAAAMALAVVILALVPSGALAGWTWLYPDPATFTSTSWAAWAGFNSTAGPFDHIQLYMVPPAPQFQTPVAMTFAGPPGWAQTLNNGLYATADGPATTSIPFPSAPWYINFTGPETAVPRVQFIAQFWNGDTKADQWLVTYAGNTWTVEQGGGSWPGGDHLYPPPDNPIAPVPPVTCITPAHACVAVPVTIARTTGEGMRGCTVDVQLAGGLTLCGAGIVEGSYLNSISTTAYQVVDNGGGSYTVDCAILGTPCGAVAASGTLFTINVGGSGTGTGTVTLTSSELRDCDNATVASSLGAPISVTIDNSAPAAIMALAASQVKLGNDGDGTTKINVSWPAVEAGATVHVYRADYGYYPEYDDGGGTVPAVPTTYPPGTGWTLAGGVTGGTSLTDEPPSRGFWYYVAYVEDPCGNVSAVSNMTGGTLDYHLGDAMAGGTTCAGDNVVDIGDISLLGSHYGVGSGSPLYLACLDVGPTTDRSVNARPTTDNMISFEDLMMFAINFGTVSLTTTPVAAVASDVLWVDGPAKVTAGQTFTASLRLSGSGTLLGLSAALGWDHAIAEIVGVEAGELVTSQNGLVLSPGDGVVDCAVLGADRRLSGDGELARVTFRALASGAPSLAVATVDARDAANRTLTLTGTPPSVLPTRTSFAPAVPNPFRGTTTLSYALAKGGTVDLAIYGVDGRKVATLANGVQEAGSYRLTWGGGNARPGLYYARLTTPEGRFTRTLVLAK